MGRGPAFPLFFSRESRNPNFSYRYPEYHFFCNLASVPKFWPVSQIQYPVNVFLSPALYFLSNPESREYPSRSCVLCLVSVLNAWKVTVCSAVHVLTKVYISAPGEEQESIIGFYNNVYMVAMKSTILQFAPNKVSSWDTVNCGL